MNTVTQNFGPRSSALSFARASLVAMSAMRVGEDEIAATEGGASGSDGGGGANVRATLEPAPFDEAKHRFLYEQYRLRSFRRRAIQWIDRAAGVLKDQVWHPQRLARALFTEICSPTWTFAGNEYSKPTEFDLKHVEDAAQAGGAITHKRWNAGLSLVAVDPADHRTMAWALGSLAIAALEDAYAELGVVSSLAHLDRYAAHHRVASMVGDELLRRWEESAPADAN